MRGRASVVVASPSKSVRFCGDCGSVCSISSVSGSVQINVPQSSVSRAISDTDAIIGRLLTAWSFSQPDCRYRANMIVNSTILCL